MVSKDRHEDAFNILSKLHANRAEEFIRGEISEIREQLALETAQRSQSSLVELFSQRYARRVLLACFILNMTKLSGGKPQRTPPSLFHARLWGIKI